MFTPGGQPDLLHTRAYGGGKGGGGAQYQPPTPTVLTDPVSGKSFVQSNNPFDYEAGKPSAADQLNAEIEQRKAQEKQDALDAQTKSDKTAADKKASDLSAFNTKKQGAYDSAMQNIMRSFQQQGLDPNQYMESDIKPTLARQLGTIQDLDPNPSSAFAPNLGETIIGNLTSGKRTTATNAYNKLFSPQYSSTALPDSLTGQYKNTLLDEQFNPLSSQLENARKRGTLSDVGYQSALGKLGEKRTAAGATIDTLGAGILNADRKGLDEYINSGRTDISNLTAAGNFDPNAYATGAQGKVATDVGAFGGALRNAVGDTKFADLNELINAGGAVQGAGNPNAANPLGRPTTATGGGALSPSFISEEELAKQKRGLGNAGAF